MRPAQVKSQKNSQTKFKVYGVFLGLAFSALTTSAASAASLSTQQCTVEFAPLENQPVVFRDESGNLLGTSAEGTDLQMPINGQALANSITARGIDVSTLLNNSEPLSGNDGKTYLKMQLPLDTITSEGRQISGGTNVLLAISDFKITRAIQPTGANDGGNCSAALINKFTDVLDAKGPTAETRPLDEPQAEPTVAPAPQKREQPAVPAPQIAAPPRTEIPDVADDSESAEAPVTNEIIMPKLGYGSPFPEKFLSAPTCGCTRGTCGIASNFGARRRPVIRRHRRVVGYGSAYHQGLDIGGGLNTPVIAAAPGKVNFVGKQGGYGYTIVLDHGNGYQTQYGHLKELPHDRNGSPVRRGQWIRRGTQIGLMGSTGLSTGPHVHFEVHQGRRRINPKIDLIASSGAMLSRSCSNLPDLNYVDRLMASALRADRRPPRRSSGRSFARSWR